jgi:hypothetical protein
VVLPNLKLIRCVKPDCLQLLEHNELPRAGDSYPENINVAYLDHWCPVGVTARYNKAITFEDLKEALEKRYGSGTREDWTGAPLLTWELKSEEIYIQLDVADERMAQGRHVEEGTKTVLYHDASRRLYCPMP